MVYVRLAVNVPGIAGEYDYHLPSDLEGRVGVGNLVTIPFGRQTVQGTVLALVETPAVAETKAVIDLLDPDPVLTAPQIELARQLSVSTLNPLAAMIELMLPPGLARQSDTVFSIVSGHFQVQESTPVQARLLKLLAECGSLRGRQIDRHFKNVDWRRTAQHLVRAGVLSSQPVLPSASVRPKYVRTAQLAVTPAQAEGAMPELGKTKTTLGRRQAALRFLIREPAPVNISWVYAESGCNLADLQELADRELIVLSEAETWRDPLQGIEMQPEEFAQPTVLTEDQQKAWEVILSSLSGQIRGPILLHGVTGSGKTELYIRAAQETIRQGKQAIILVPEISLTPQTVHRFHARFPGQVGLIHSRLSVGERYDTWRRARAGKLKIVIGPRSALFTPFSRVGLIVADECHDGSYYQSEPPFFHAISAVQSYARLCGAACILGSATPTMVQRYQSETGGSVYLELPLRISRDAGEGGSLQLPPVSIVDMRQELKAGNRSIFSQVLVESLEESLKRSEQAILFLNRRGTATYVFCRDCGHSLKCPQCELPLTSHTQIPGVELICHRCGYTRRTPRTCPQCGSEQIRQYGLGSERVETEVQALFPGVRTLRWDRETTRHKDSHEIILNHFIAHRADVLVGTQMLAKGLDLPLVTLVGIVLADVGLNLPDPFSAERLFQVLTQVAGRAGRSKRGGRVILQTFQPQHYAIQHASRHDYAAFYAQELAYRKKLHYPPFGRLVRLEYRDRQMEVARDTAQAMAERISSALKIGERIETDMIGPVPCYFSRLGGVYRWQIVLRGPRPETLLGGMKLDQWRVEVEPVSLL